ncbi:MAG: hypothetical protein V4689_05945 [Verrucomicrobiota bacterium]
MSRSFPTVIPRHPLDHENVVKFALGESITAALKNSGTYHLLVTAPSDATTPDHLRGRRIVHAVVATKEQLDSAYGVLAGTHTAKRIKQPTPPKP